jgi:hypothetical protein
MKTNELKKGDRVQLRNGWYATIADNMKGNTRLATVEGFVTETGSVYAWDIAEKVDVLEGDPVHGVEYLINMATGTFETRTPVELTPKQIKARAMSEAIFG